MMEIIKKWKEAEYSEMESLKIRENYLTWSVAKCNKMK